MEVLCLTGLIGLIVFVGIVWLLNLLSRRHQEWFVKSLLLTTFLSFMTACASYFILEADLNQQVTQGPGGPSGAIAAGFGGFFILLYSLGIFIVGFVAITLASAVVLEILHRRSRNKQQSQIEA